LWPAPTNFQWADYYTAPPIEVINKAKEFLLDWQINYEIIDWNKDVLMYHLKQSPLQVTIPGHAIMNFFTTADIIRYFDTYSPYIKETQQIGSALKYVLTRKKKIMTSEEVRKQYRLSFYRDPDAGELAYWTGRPLLEFLNTAIKDRAEFLNSPI
jgi:hypothetical protein